MNTSNITRFFVVILFIFMAAIAANMVSAATVEISGNGSSSDSTVQINQSSTNVIDQQNSVNVNNNVGGTADTGGNSVNGNTGGNNNVTTGDATVNTSICNNLNTNVVGGGAGSINNPCLTPTKAQNANPTPTSPPAGGLGVGGTGSSNGGGSSSSGGSSSGGVGGGSVQGLSTTSGENELVNLLKLLPAFGFLLLGGTLLRKHA